MLDKLTNLLPLSRQRLLAREYYFRLGVVIMLMITTLTLIAMVLMVPTYIFLVGSANVKEARLASLASAPSSAEDTALSTRLAALSNETAILMALSRASSTSAIMRAVLALPRPGIALSGFIYTPSTDKKSGTLNLSGTAATRNALRNYQLSLQSAPFALSAGLPVSAYAKDANITFTITVTLAP